MINFSIQYYEDNNDIKNLAIAYFYKSTLLFDKKDIQNSLLFMKKAEQAAKEAKDKSVLITALLNLSFINTETGAYKKGLEYGYMALKEGKEQNKAELLCPVYNNMATCFYYLGIKDSADFYISKLHEQIKGLQSDELSMYLNNIGMIYKEGGNYEKARPFLEEALRLYPHPTMQTNLALTYYMLGKDREADSLSRMVLDNGSHENKVEILQFLAERAEKGGNFKEATALFRRAKAMQDSINYSKQTEETVATQRDYEQERLVKEMERRENKAGAITALVVIALMAASLIWYRRRMSRVGKIIADNNKKIEMYGKQIETLEQSDTRRSNEIASLEKKIRKLKEEQSVIIRNGKLLYEGVMQGGDTAKWNRKNFEEFVEYYRIEHPKAVEEAEKKYNKLSSTNIFYLIIAGMGYDDNEAQRILCMSQGAFRTMKSRIKAKRA